MDFESQELFPCLTSRPVQPAATWQKRNMPGLELAAESSIERLDIPKENLVRFEYSLKIKNTLGPSIADICKSLMARRKVSVELSSNKKTGMVTLIVHGSPSDVLTAKKELISQLTIPKVVTLNIPSIAKPFVIGKGGLTLKRITLRSMTKIVIPKKDSNELDSVEIVITGDDEGIEMARSEIMEIVRKQISNYRGKTMVPKFLHQFIGPTISALEKDMNVKVHLPPLHGQNDQNISEEIVIVGEMDNVVSAVYKLNKIVAELPRSLGTIAVPLKKSQHRFIVGAKGRGKQEIFDKTGCVVIIPDASDPSETVTIRGPEHMLSMALQAALEKANSVIIGTVDCQSIMPLSYHQVLLYLRYLFTKEISLIKELQSQKSVSIYRQAASPMILEVQGRSRHELDEGMTALKALISSHTKFLYPQVVDLPHELHSFIIGKGGQNISKLKHHPQTNGRLLDILLSPDKDKLNDVGIILARDTSKNYLSLKDSNDEAERMISIITALILEDATKAANSRTEELLINSRFHGRLIGSGGSMMKEILGSFHDSVKLTFFSSKTSNDSITEGNTLNDKIVIRGNMNGVHQVSQKIQSMVNQWEKIESLTSYSQRIVVSDEIMKALFSGFSDAENELDHASFAWLVRDIRKKVTETPALLNLIDKDQSGIYSHRNYHLRLLRELNALIILGPKLIVPVAVKIVNEMIEKESKNVLLEFSLLESLSLSDGNIVPSDVYSRVLGRIIGKDGKNIKKLGEKYNVNVTFSKPNGSNQEIEVLEDKRSSQGLVSLKGLKDDVDAIHKKLVENFATEIKKSYELVFNIPKATVAGLLSLRDFSSKNIKSTYSVILKIDETDDNATVMLEGEKCDCETVKALILVEVDELVNHLSVVLSIPNYLHKHLIGPKGETITQIMNSFNDHGKIHFDIPKKSFSLAGLDFVTIKCHKEVAHSIQSRIDDLLSGLLFPEGESMEISSLYSNGLESYISLSLKDFKRIGGYHGEKLIDLSRKYRAFVFVEDELPDSVKLRLEEKQETAYLDIPAVIYQNFDNSSSETFFFKNLISKLEKEFHAVFDINPSQVKSGKVQVQCSTRNLAPLQMFFNSKMQKLGGKTFISHLTIPMKCIGRIIGKGGETLKKIRQTSGALVDIYTDRENGQEIAVLSGPSVNAVDIAELEIGKLLRTFAPTLIENKKEDPIDDTLRPQFPPGYSDNFYKANLRYSQKPQMINSFSDPSLTHDESTRDTYYQTDYNHSFPFDSSQTSTLCDGLKWHTIKGGKAIEGEQVTKNSKKKKNKKKNGARNAPLDPVVV